MREVGRHRYFRVVLFVQLRNLNLELEMHLLRVEGKSNMATYISENWHKYNCPKCHSLLLWAFKEVTRRIALQP